MSSDDLEAARSAAIAAGKRFSKGRLREEFRMKPAPDAVPVTFYKDGYGGKFGVYRIADCVPIREHNGAAVSAKQQRARAILAIKSKLRSKQAEISAIAGEWLAQEPLFLDTETTDLGSDAQIIEIGVVDGNGKVLLDTRLRPTVGINPKAQAIHGIDERALANAPTWPDVAREIQNLLQGRLLVFFNADFDVRMFNQTAEAFGEPINWWQDVDIVCAMYLATDIYGATNRYGTISLATATALAGVTWGGRAHSATADALATADLVKAMAEIRAALNRELATLSAASGSGTPS